MKFNLDDDVKLAWRASYKPPLMEKCADLQWEILHGIVAVNYFVSVINPAVDDVSFLCRKRNCFSMFYGM